MFPSEGEVLEGYAAVCASLGLPTRASPAGVRVALASAEQLAEDVFEGPAALLYAFARVPRAFAAHRTMTVLLTLAQASASGQHLAATPRELAEWVERAARGELGYQDVRSALAERLLPFGG